MTTVDFQVLKIGWDRIHNIMIPNAIEVGSLTLEIDNFL
ncbi:hypothetical protein CKA32_001988 [Geitlerinema sp. FC II]|nr:hypothetical protein CKA32_001988 [Geitlerinema sp. FC II]